MNYSLTLELQGSATQSGFRPLLWRLAALCEVGGWIRSEGRLSFLHLEGDDLDLENFLHLLPGKLYPDFSISGIRLLEKEAIPPDQEPDRTFRSLGADRSKAPVIEPDLPPCQDCLNEMQDPASRRYRHPFTACKKCGSRFSYLRATPFIRKNTYLNAFPMCRECRAEFESFTDKHHGGSELLSCKKCGPHLFLMDMDGLLLEENNAPLAARRAIADGQVLAFQNIVGGVRLCADARNRAALRSLRKRSGMRNETFSLTARDMNAVRDWFECSEEQEKLLTDPACPRVELRFREELSNEVPRGIIAPDGGPVCVMLPPTLLIHLVIGLRDDDPPPFPFIAMHESSKCMTTEEHEKSMSALHSVADCFMGYDMRTSSECGASVVGLRNGIPQILRNGRGFAPQELRLAKQMRRTPIGFGTDINAGFAFGIGNRVALSPHLGSFNQNVSIEAINEYAERMIALYDTLPDCAVSDMNDELFSSRAAAVFARRYSIPLIQVYYHHALALGCMAETGMEHCLALEFDHGALGSDGDVWGAELLEVNLEHFRRLGTFSPERIAGLDPECPFPFQEFLCRADAIADHPEQTEWKKQTLDPSLSRSVHSCGGLIDAVCAALGLARELKTYRAQTNLLLSEAARRAKGPVPDSIRQRMRFAEIEEDGLLMIDWAPLFHELSRPDWITLDNLSWVARSFYDSLAESAVRLVEFAADSSSDRNILLAGSCFLNPLLLETVSEKLVDAGFQALHQRRIPPDEFGCAAGQVFHAGLSRI